MTGPFGFSELLWFHVVVELGTGLLTLATWAVVLRMLPRALVQVITELEEAQDG